MTTVATPKPSPLPHRGVPGFFGAILAGLAAGGFAWVGVALGPHYFFFIGFLLLVPVPLFLAGLGIGRSDAIVATLIFAALVIMEMREWAPYFLAIYALPALILCLLATRYRYDETGQLFWYPTGRLLIILALYPVLVYGLVSALADSKGIEAVMHNVSTIFVDKLLQSGPNNGLDSPENRLRVIANVTTLLPVCALIGWIFALAISGMWAQIALTSNKLALRPMPSLVDIDLPMAYLVLLAIMVLLAYFYEGSVAYFARGTLVPMSMPYFMLGLGVIHLWARQSKHKSIWLTLTYFLLMLQWPMVLVAALGVVEPWLHIRTKITAKAARLRKV